MIEVKPGYDILTPISDGGKEELRKIELAARTCYKSEGAIKEGSAEKLVRKLIESGHEAMLEHSQLSVRFTVDRGISHEIVRHREASFAQESTRYCVAGSTLLTTDSKVLEKIDVETMYEYPEMMSDFMILQCDSHNAYKETYGRIKDVHRIEEPKRCIQLFTESCSLICTPDHEIMLDTGAYKKAGTLTPGDWVIVSSENGQTTEEEVRRIRNISEKQTVYDVEMEGDIHNFIADGIVVHNCNYSKDKFDNEIRAIIPSMLEDDADRELVKSAYRMSETMYKALIKHGVAPQIARCVLPTGLKTEIVVTANYREWRHIFKLRCAPDAHPQIREVMIPLLEELKQKIPVIFDDIATEEGI